MIDRPDLPLGNVYTKHGSLLSSKSEDGTWCEYAYIEKSDGYGDYDHEISYKTHTGYCRTTTRDSNLNIHETMDSNGRWSKYKYNEKGQELEHTSSDGHWSKTEYDSFGNRTLYTRSDGYKYEATYDRNGNELSVKNTEGFWSITTYNDDGSQDTYADSQGKDSGYYAPYLYWKRKAERLEEELKQLKCLSF